MRIMPVICSQLPLENTFYIILIFKAHFFHIESQYLWLRNAVLMQSHKFFESPKQNLKCNWDLSRNISIRIPSSTSSFNQYGVISGNILSFCQLEPITEKWWPDDRLNQICTLTPMSLFTGVSLTPNNPDGLFDPMCCLIWILDVWTILKHVSRYSGISKKSVALIMRYSL